MKQTRLFLMFAMLALAGIAQAASNKLVVKDVSMEAGNSVNLDVVLENETANLMGFQCDILLPEGLTLKLKSNGKPAATLGGRFEDTGHTISSSVTSSGAYRFIATSLDGEAIPGANGTLFTVTLQADAVLAPGTILSGFVKNIEFNTQDNQKLVFDDVTFNVSIPEEVGTIEVKIISCTREYGEANPTFEYTVEGKNLDGTPEITCDATQRSPIGTYDIIISQGTVTNTNVTYVNGTLTITRAPLTIKAGSYTKKQGEQNPEFTLTYEGFKNDETSEVLTKQPTVNCEADENSALGEYDVTVSGAEAQNYDINYVNGKLVVTEGELSQENFEVNGVLYHIIKQPNEETPGEVEVQKSLSDGGYLGDIVIPAKVVLNDKNYQVTTIGIDAFRGCINLSSITIPNSVKKIPDFSFADCSNLSSAKTGNGVDSIGNWAFSSCRNLATVKMGNKVISIGDYAFSDCGSLTSIILPNSLESIGSHAFQGSNALTSINIPGSVMAVGSAAFDNCSSLSSVILEEGITSIGDWAFNYNAFTSITIPNSVESIGEFAFSSNHKLTTVVLGEGITEIANNTFNGCSALTSIIIPEGVTTIGDQAFCDCHALTSVKLPETLTSMGERVFSLSALKSIELPNSFTVIPDGLFSGNNFQYIKMGNSVKSIGNNAFGSREPVIEISTPTPPVIDKAAFPNVEYLADLNVIVPDATAENAYRKAAVWQEMTFANQDNISEVTVETPGDLSFELITQCNMMPAKVVDLKVNGSINADDFKQMLVNMKSLLRLDLSDCDITEMPDYALNGKTQLQEIILPSRLQTIGNSALKGCPYLTGQLSLPSTVTSIGTSAFMGTSYTSVTLPSALKTIGEKAFDNVPIKQRLVIPNRVTNVGASAFAGTKITGLVIPDGVTSIGDRAFADTPIQGHVTVPDGVTYLGTGAFSNSQLSTVFLPNSVATLSEGLFQGCPNLDLVYIPDNYTGVDRSAFDGCGALQILRLSANLATMGAYSFQSTPLEYLKVPAQVEVLSQGVLKSCSNLESLTLPANLNTVETEALYGCTSLRNLSVEAVEPPVIKDRNAIRGINTDKCLISIPTTSYRSYVLAEYWGQFVQMRNDIAVETEGNGEIAFESVEDEEEEVSEARRTAMRNAAARAARRAPALATEEESLTFANNGSSVYVPQEGIVRFYIIPAEGEEILSATLDGEDIMPYIVDGVYTATADKKNAKLVVKFTGASQVDVEPNGDINRDGVVNIADAAAVLNVMAGNSTNNGDVNGDGVVNIADVAAVLNIMAGKQ